MEKMVPGVEKNQIFWNFLFLEDYLLLYFELLIEKYFDFIDFSPLTLALSSWSNITHLHGGFWSLNHISIKIILIWTLSSNA